MNRLINFLLRLKYSKLPIKALQDKDTYIKVSEGGNIEIIQNTYKEWASKYSQEASTYEYPPIDWYCGCPHDEINGKLRKLTPYLPPHLIDIANNLSVEILKAPRTPHNLIAYRALDKKIIEEIIEKAMEDKPYIDHGFISTSINYDCLLEEEFAHYKGILKLYIPANTPAIYIDQIRTKYLSRRDEQELLIHPNAIFQIINRPYTMGGRLFLECTIKHGDGYKPLNYL